MYDGISNGVEQKLRPALTPELARTTAIHVNLSALVDLCADHHITTEDLQTTPIVFTHSRALMSPDAPATIPRWPAITEFGLFQATDVQTEATSSQHSIIKVSVPAIIDASLLGLRLRDHQYEHTPNATLLDENVSSTLVHEVLHYSHYLQRQRGDIKAARLPLHMPKSRIGQRYARELPKLTQRSSEEILVQGQVNELFHESPLLAKLVTLELL